LGFSRQEGRGYAYISQQAPGPQLKQLLDDKGFVRIALFGRDEAARDKFLAEYVDAVGAASRELNSRIWWATDIASKNRFNSQLSHLLQFFLTVAEAVKDKKLKVIVVISPSWVIVSSIKDAVVLAGSRVVSLGFSFNRWAEPVYSYCRKSIGVFYHIAHLTWRAGCVRRALRGKIAPALKKKKPYYIAKTFIYDHSFKENGRYCDIFFGRLLGLLKTRKNLLVYACIVGNYKKCLAAIKECGEYVIMPVEYSFSFLDMVSVKRSESAIAMLY